MIIIQVLSPRLKWTCHNFNPRALSHDDKLLISVRVPIMLYGYSSLYHVLFPHLGELILTFIYLFIYLFIGISFKVIKESSRKIVP